MTEKMQAYVRQSAQRGFCAVLPKGGIGNLPKEKKLL